MKPPSNVTDDRATPVWAPRVRQHKIRQLYEDDAKGIYDEGLINDVGYALLARCLSFIAANEATQGKALLNSVPPCQPATDRLKYRPPPRGGS